MNESDRVIAKIGHLAYGGSFVGTIEKGPEHYIGKKIFIREVYTGEVVEAQILKDKDNFVEGSALSIIENSDNRVSPPCPAFGICGGCDLQHISIEAQRIAKIGMVRETLKLKAKVAPLNGIDLLGDNLPDYKYRRRVSLHVSKDGKIGFFKGTSREVVDIKKCLLAIDPINDAIDKIRPHLKSLIPTLSGLSIEEISDEIVIIFSLDPKVSIERNIERNYSSLNEIFPYIKLIHRDKIITNTIPHRISIAGSFSQVNKEANLVLSKCIIDNCSFKSVTELYAGSGNFTFGLAGKASVIDAVEVNPILAEAGNSNAKKMKLSDRITFYNLSSEEFIQRYTLNECLVLDPPRGGAKSLIPSIISSKSKEIIYVSCSLPSLARDLYELKKGGFSLEKIFLVDMFPQTHHIETVSILFR